MEIKFGYERAKKFAAAGICICLAALCLYVFAKYIWCAIIPFLLAYFFAECFKPLIKYSEKHKKFPARLFVLLLIIISVCAATALLYAIAREIINEMRNFAFYISDVLTKIKDDTDYAEGIIGKIDSLVPFADIKPKLWEIRGDLNNKISDFLLNTADEISGDMLGFIGGVIKFLPSALLTVAVFVIATYYLSVDRINISNSVLSFFNKKNAAKLKKAKDELCATGFKFIRAYMLIFLITFGELFISFSVIKIDYPFIIALATAVIDILPIVGTGTVLIPWGIAEMAFGNYTRGIELLVIYAVITVVRQLIEPKIVGKYIGLSPFVSLLTMYIGLKIWGIWGLFIFPLGALFIKKLRFGDQLRQSTSETLITPSSEERSETNF